VHKKWKDRKRKREMLAQRVASNWLVKLPPFVSLFFFSVSEKFLRARVRGIRATGHRCMDRYWKSRNQNYTRER